jgi:ribosomal protein L24
MTMVEPRAFQIGNRVRIKAGDHSGRMGRVVQVQERYSGYFMHSIRMDGCKTPVWITNHLALEIISPLEHLSEIQ